ncbi:unnamed protein product [Penicillium olsonii]|uniref:Uncharacterized protein n=1 Tax=Penicillium olsonii TaxID=99116 RepID=A0A9W4I8P0_PENOL|nr:unnamed protein product [Penicillium olsonii]CAG8261977.1 unnamed protein product [Penicillium olsonii]
MSTRYSVSEGFSLLKSLVFPLLLLSLITTVNATSACYFPNGARSPDDSPCYTDDDGVASHCCSSTSICLTNKLCLSMEQPYELSRGSCTDADWKSGSCPLGLCEKAQPGTGVAIMLFNGTGSAASYCCNSVLTNATTGENMCSDVDGSPQSSFTITEGEIIPGTAALSDLVRKSDKSSSSVVTNTSRASTESESTKEDHSKEVAIGAGVGVPLGVLALAAVGWALSERRKRKRAYFQPEQSDHLAHSVQPVQPVVAHERSVEMGELDPDGSKPPEMYSHSPRG